MSTKKAKVYKEYFAFDIIDDGDGPYIVDHEISYSLKDAQNYQYYVVIELPARTNKTSKQLAVVKI